MTYYSTFKPRYSLFFFFNDTATTEIYTLSLHDALPIYIFGPGDLVNSGDPTAETWPQEIVKALEIKVLPLNSEAIRKALQERSEEHTSELQSQSNLVCRLLLEKKKI